MVQAHLMGALPRILQERTGDQAIEKVFAQQAIPLEITENRERWLPIVDMLGLFEQSSRYAGDPLFSLEVAKSMDPSAMGLWGRYLSQAADFETFFARLAQIRPFMQTGTVFRIARGGDGVVLSATLASSVKIGRRHFSIRFVAPVLAALRRYAGERDVAPLVKIEGISKTECRRLEEELQTRVAVGDGLTEIYTKEKFLRRRPDDMPRPDPRDIILMGDLMRQYAPAMSNDFLEAISRVANLRLLEGKADIDGTAKLMRMGTRTLQREMNGAGMSYRDLITRLRAERAKGYLEETSLTVSEIAFQLGYSESSHFIRAFEKVTGASPSRYRACR